MTKYEKIAKLIREYQQRADKHFEKYKKEEAAAREKFSPEGFKSEFMRGTWPKFAGLARADADSIFREITYIFDEIEEDFKKYVMAPLDASIVQILDCIGKFDLNLSLNELQVIEQSVKGSYFGTKIFSGLCHKNGYIINIPEMKDYMEALRSARENTKVAIMAYAGSSEKGFPGRDLIAEREWNGIKQGEYEVYHLTMAENFLHSGGTLERLEKMWIQAQAPILYTLTSREAKKVGESIKKIVGKNGEVDKEAAAEVLKQEPDFKSKLQSMPDRNLEGFEAVAKHFHLDCENKEKGEQSEILPSVQQAAQYPGGKPKVVDPDSLRNFR